MMLATLLLLTAPPLHAAAPAPGTVTVAAKPAGDTLSAEWPDLEGARKKLTATFPPGALTTATALHFEEGALMVVLGERLQAWASKTRPGSTVVVKGKDVTLATPRTDPAKAESENAETRAEQERLYMALLAEHHLGIVGPGQLQYDHARMAAESAPLLRPLVDALGPPKSTDVAEVRAFAARALAFVQGLPTEELARDTFAPPLALLGEQHGNSDEKATLYAALIRAVAPELPVAVVTMRAHALVGLGLPLLAGDRTVTVEGTTWMLADVAGPTVHELGRVGPRSDFQQLSVRRVP